MRQVYRMNNGIDRMRRIAWRLGRREGGGELDWHVPRPPTDSAGPIAPSCRGTCPSASRSEVRAPPPAAWTRPSPQWPPPSLPRSVGGAETAHWTAHWMGWTSHINCANPGKVARGGLGARCVHTSDPRCRVCCECGSEPQHQVVENGLRRGSTVILRRSRCAHPDRPAASAPPAAR